MSCWFIYISIAKKEKGKFLLSTSLHYTIYVGWHNYSNIREQITLIFSV